MEKNELMHYGVLGMKWGVHRLNRATANAIYNKIQKKHATVKVNEYKTSRNPIKKASTAYNNLEIKYRDKMIKKGEAKIKQILEKLEREGATLSTIESVLYRNHGDTTVHFVGPKYVLNKLK